MDAAVALLHGRRRGPPPQYSSRRPGEARADLTSARPASVHGPDADGRTAPARVDRALPRQLSGRREVPADLKGLWLDAGALPAGVAGGRCATGRAGARARTGDRLPGALHPSRARDPAPLLSRGALLLRLVRSGRASSKTPPSAASATCRSRCGSSSPSARQKRSSNCSTPAIPSTPMGLRDRALLLTLLDSGIRCSETVGLDLVRL